MAEQFEVLAPTNVKGLISGKVPSMSEAIRTRSTEKFRTSSSSVFGENNRTIQIRVQSAHYADLTTACLHFSLTTDSPLQLTEDLTALSAIEGARVTCAGREVERINQVRALKPIIYASVSREYYDTTLNVGVGTWKYRPSYMGVLSVRQSGIPIYNAASGSNSNGYTTTLASTATYSTDIHDDPLKVYLLAGEATDNTVDSLGGGSTMPSGIGAGTHTGYMKAPISRDLATFSSHDMCPANQVGSNILGGCVLPTSLNTWDSTSSDANMLISPATVGNIKNKDGLNGTNTRDYSVPLSLIFGCCRTDDVLFPLRNVGEMTFEFDLARYGDWFLHNIPKGGAKGSMETRVNLLNTSFASGTEANKVSQSSYATYSVVTPSITVDICQASDAIVKRVDMMCSSAEGFSMAIESYATITTPFDYSESVALNYLQGYSSLRDVYVSFQPAKGLNPYFPKSDFWLGSRFEEASLQVGSTQFPVQNIRGASQAYVELLKSFSHLDSKHQKAGGVIDYDAYVGKRTTPTPECPASAGLMPSLAVANFTTKRAGMCQVGMMPTQKPSCFLLGQSLEKVLKETTRTFSGISSRASGLGLTHNLKFKPIRDTDPYADPTSSWNPQYLDAALGNGYDMLALTALHHDVLLTIANDSLSVAT